MCLWLTCPNVLAKPHLWIIELKNGQDNRLTTEFITTGIMPALDEVERQWRAQWGQAQQQKKKELGNGALIITGRQDQDKFFSNGGCSAGHNVFAAANCPVRPRLRRRKQQPRFYCNVLPAYAVDRCFLTGLVFTTPCYRRLQSNGAKSFDFSE